MKDFIDYIESSCSSIPDSPVLYRYKKKVLDAATERANEITHSGLTDANVLTDIIRGEFPDLKTGYEAFAEEERRKAKARFMRKLNIIGSVAFFLLIFLVYFSVSFTTQRWDISWLIIVGGVFALTIYLLSFGIKRLCKMKRAFQPIARLLTAGSIMLATVFIFLFCLMLVPMSNSWTIVLGGVIALFIADGIFAAVTRQKLAIINYFLYIPASMALLYVILGAYSVVSWSNGWLLVILGVIIDLVIAAGIMINNAKYIYKQEAEDVWQEN